MNVAHLMIVGQIWKSDANINSGAVMDGCSYEIMQVDTDRNRIQLHWIDGPWAGETQWHSNDQYACETLVTDVAEGVAPVADPVAAVVEPIEDSVIDEVLSNHSALIESLEDRLEREREIRDAAQEVYRTSKAQVSKLLAALKVAKSMEKAGKEAANA